MPQTSKTGYSMIAGGGRGYINIGGWNSTLTDQATNPQEVIGVFRKEGMNTYVYGVIGTATATKGTFVQPISGTVYTCGASNVIPPMIFTVIPAGGTARLVNFKAWAIQDTTTNQYAWFQVAGIATMQCQTNTTTLAAGDPVMPATDSNAKIKVADATDHTFGWTMTAIACDVSGQAVFSLMKNW